MGRTRVVFGRTRVRCPKPMVCNNIQVILLNLVLSCIAAIQAQVIMISQNRQEEKERIRAEHDYEINLKAEILIEDLLIRLAKLEENQRILMAEQKEVLGTIAKITK